MKRMVALIVFSVFSVFGRCGERPTGELQRKAQELADYAVKNGLQGALQFCAFKDGKCVIDVWAGTMTTNAGAAKIDGSTLFPIFSTEKPLLATAVHRTVEEGRLAYDQPVSTVWPEFTGGGKEKLTVRELLGYRSGMPDNKGGAVFSPEGTRIMSDWKAMLDWFASVPPDIVPGTKQRYMAKSYGWAHGGTLEKVWKKPANEVLREQVLIPAGIDLIAIDQDPLGLQAYVLDRHWKEDVRVYAKPLAPEGTSTFAIALYNGTDGEQDVTCVLSMLGIEGEVSVRDCFEQKDLGEAKGEITRRLPPHATRIRTRGIRPGDVVRIDLDFGLHTRHRSEF